MGKFINIVHEKRVANYTVGNYGDDKKCRANKNVVERLRYVFG